ncbi:hypothetical protein [Rhodococcus sp. 21391]|nr:hypothetical protein [Rhodococcus sp. 21391]QQZ12578.1 hypothetical protein GO592_22605 [Rhodococcus sp. 21391]
MKVASVRVEQRRRPDVVFALEEDRAVLAPQRRMPNAVEAADDECDRAE